MVNNNLESIFTGTKIDGCNKKTGSEDSSKTIVVTIEEPSKCLIKHVHVVNYMFFLLIETC